jgi:hypothetical protein
MAMEDQIGDLAAFLKGMHALINQYKSASGPSGHNVDHEHWGLGDGVVTTIIPTLVIDARNPKTIYLTNITLSSSYVSDVDQSRPNHSLPHVEFQS